MQVRRLFTILLLLSAWLLHGTAYVVAATPNVVPEHGEIDAATTASTVELDSAAMAVRVDELLQQSWKDAGVEPAPLASDSEFLRRVYLDLVGVIPRASEVREFLADARPDKRALVVDRLLASPRHATHMATILRNRILPLGVDPTHDREVLGLQKWLRTRFAKNLRYDNLVGGLMLTSGGDEIGPRALLPRQRSRARENGRQRC